MMNMNNNLKIDFANKTIFISARLAKAAFDISTEEFVYVSKLLAAYPTFELSQKEIKKNSNKQSYSGLSICKMKAFIICQKDEKALNEFESIISIYKNEKGKYASIKRNFLNRYKVEYNSLSEEEMIAIDNLATELKNNPHKAVSAKNLEAVA